MESPPSWKDLLGSSQKELRENPEHLNRLMEVLLHGSVEDRSAIRESLGGAVLREGLRSEDHWLRLLAAEVLEREFWLEEAETEEALRVALRDEDPDVGRHAAVALGWGSTQRVVPWLLEAMGDSRLSSWVRGGVLRALGRLKVREVVPALVRIVEQPDEAFKEGFDEASRLFLRDEMKKDALWALGALGSLAAEAVPVLRACLDASHSLSFKKAVVEALRAMGVRGSELEEVLCAALASGSSGDLRAELLAMLAGLPPERPESLRPLVQALRDPNRSVSSVAAANLRSAAQDRPEHVACIVGWLRDEDPAMRSVAAEALGVLGVLAEGMGESLVEALLGPSSQARARAVESLRRFGTKAGACVPLLVARLKEVGPEEHVMAWKVLGPMSGGVLEGEVREALSAGMSDGNARVRQAALEGLCDFSEVDAELKRLAGERLGDEDESVREAAVQAVALLRPEEVPEVAAGEDPRAEGAWAVARASRHTGFSLYRALRGREENLVLSPLSVFTLLALALRGTRGATESRLKESLRWPSEPALLSGALRELASKLCADGEDFVLTSDNGFWKQEGYPVRPEYLSELEACFGASPAVVDFARAPEEACAAINHWVAERTRGRISGILSPGDLEPATRFVLANAVFLRALWQKPFPHDTTHDAPFLLLDGREVRVPMMGHLAEYGYAVGSDYQLIELPYRGGHTVMRVVLPEPGFFERVERLWVEGRSEAFLHPVPKEYIYLSLPRFELRSRVGLAELAGELGLGALFERDADLSGLTPEREPFRCRLMHEANLSVDEKGTEASAVTAVFHVGGAPPPVVTVNRPFLFFLQHVGTGALLFLGRVLDPRGPLSR